MSTAVSKDELLAKALSLKPRDRINLAEELWLSADDTTREEVSEAWAKKFDRVRPSSYPVSRSCAPPGGWSRSDGVDEAQISSRGCHRDARCCSFLRGPIGRTWR